MREVLENLLQLTKGLEVHMVASFCYFGGMHSAAGGQYCENCQVTVQGLVGK